MRPPSSNHQYGSKPSKSARVLSAKSTTPYVTSMKAVHAKGERLSKIMASRGLCSRREADAFIARGMVWVDGVQITQLGTRIDAKANIVLAAHAHAQQASLRTILLHKPIGYVSGQPEPGCIPAITLIKPEQFFHTSHTPPIDASVLPKTLKGIAPAGRLDIDSTGLLVFTQDGRVARQLIGENTGVEKEYLVRVNALPDDKSLRLLNHGLSLDGKILRPAKVKIINDGQLQFILREGRKRQIRRMCELVGIRAIGLKRVRIGNVFLSNLPLGRWRFLADKETF